ncbi:hypothetical protein H4R20_000643 [Coemansia guatemalensis]|uniref:Uncharacterized protein n=1 Tax=Coemansia guatemalensis TaxID=2761395 RepID=A0A9W8I5V1_9FUNG|nr:hypothetical protein H4R20_000643 [Coemansia guatemalensis]
MRLKGPDSDGAPRIAVIVASPEQQLNAAERGCRIDCSGAQQALEIATRHEATIKLMSKEPAICICAEGAGSSLVSVSKCRWEKIIGAGFYFLLDPWGLRVRPRLHKMKWTEICFIGGWALHRLHGREEQDRSSGGEEQDLSGEIATAVITPHVRVIGRLAEKQLQSPNRDTAAVSKLETELAKVQRIVASEGYRRRAPDAVKEADR